MALLSCRQVLKKFSSELQFGHGFGRVQSLVGAQFVGRRANSQTSSSRYEEAFRKSISRPEQFWGEAAEDITWFKRWDRVLDHSNPPFTKWFVGGTLNTCYNAIDVHVDKGHGDEVALVYDSPIAGVKKSYTYSDLKIQAAKFARVLINFGVQKGDRVLIYMPMMPEAVIAMYGCARIGAVHSVVFGGFAPNELARRIDDAEPKIVVTASCGLEPGKTLPYQPLVETALKRVNHQPDRIIIVERAPHCTVQLTPGRDIEWDEVMTGARPHDCVPVDSNDPLYILYTSGTTGKPKGIARPNGGHAVALKWTMSNLYGVNSGEAWWAASDIGWVVGHSYIVYAPLLKRCKTILYEGKPVGCPDAGTFFRVIDEHDVVSLFTAPSAMRVIRNEDPTGSFAKKYSMKKFRALFLAGENADNDILQWSQRILDNRPVLDHWWQTETGWPITNHHAGLGLPLRYPFGTSGKPSPGWNTVVLDENQSVCKPGELGRVFVELPLPPGAMSTLWRDDDRFIDNYFMAHKGFYDTSDAGIMDENGYLRIEGRLDDVINVSGHRLSTKQMERAIARHPDVYEQAVIGMKDPIKGVVPVGLVVLAKGFNRSKKTLCDEIVELVRQDIGPVASFKKVVILPTLPKTRAGKFVRGTLKKMLDGSAYDIPQTVENPEDFTKVEKILKEQKGSW